MKQITLSASKKLALVALAAISFAACKNEQAPKQGTASKSAATTTSSDKESDDATVAAAEIVYVNSDSLLTNYELYKEVRTRLEGKSKNLESSLQKQAASFQREVGQYQQSAQGMTQEQRAATEQRLGQKQQQLAAQQQNAGNQLASEENEETKKIYDKVEAYLKRISKDKGYKMVLTYQRGNSAILYGDESLDITKEVVAGLNEEYKASKEKK